MMIYGDIGTSPLYLGPLLIVPLSNPVNTVSIYGATSCVFWTLTSQCTFINAFVNLSYRKYRERLYTC